MKTSIITSVLILIAIVLCVCIAKESNKRNALIDEYELKLVNSWPRGEVDECRDQLQDCMDQLGIFYKEPK